MGTTVQEGFVKLMSYRNFRPWGFPWGRAAAPRLARGSPGTSAGFPQGNPVRISEHPEAHPEAETGRIAREGGAAPGGGAQGSPRREGWRREGEPGDRPGGRSGPGGRAGGSPGEEGRRREKAGGSPGRGAYRPQKG